MKYEKKTVGVLNRDNLIFTHSSFLNLVIKNKIFHHSIYCRGILCFIFLVLLGSCSFTAPKILSYSAKRILVEDDKGALNERLSVFLLYNDGDGKNDYNCITVTHIDSSLQWNISRENSLYFTLKNESNNSTKIYIGSNKFAHPLGSFEDGKYRIVSEDLYGNRDTQIFELVKNNFNKVLPFILNFSSKGLSVQIIDTQEKFKYFIVFLGADKQPIFSQDFDVHGADFIVPLEKIYEDYKDVRYIQCVAERTDGTFAYISKAYSNADSKAISSDNKNDSGSSTNK